MVKLKCRDQNEKKKKNQNTGAKSAFTPIFYWAGQPIKYQSLLEPKRYKNLLTIFFFLKGFVLIPEQNELNWIKLDER